MGTLSGGGTHRVSLGERALLGANAGLGISLGDDSVVESGLYVTAGTKVVLVGAAPNPDGTPEDGQGRRAVRHAERAVPPQQPDRRGRGAPAPGRGHPAEHRAARVAPRVARHRAWNLRLMFQNLYPARRRRSGASSGLQGDHHVTSNHRPLGRDGDRDRRDQPGRGSGCASSERPSARYRRPGPGRHEHHLGSARHRHRRGSSRPGTSTSERVDPDGTRTTTIELNDGLSFDVVQPDAQTRLGAGSDGYGPYVSFNATDQSAIISGAGWALGAGVCAISAGTFCVVAGAIVAAATWAVTTNGIRCGSKSLRVYPFNGSRSPRCV